MKQSADTSNKNKIILDYLLQGLGNDVRPYLKVSILDNEVLGLLDSGASLTFLGKPGLELIERLGLRITNQDDNNNCILANGQHCRCTGYVMVPISLENKSCLVKAAVVPELPQCLILGIDFWSQMGIVPDIRNKSWHFSNNDLFLNSLESSSDFMITDSQRRELDCMVQDYFKDIPSSLGCTDAVEHKIKVEGSEPIKLRSYPVSPKIQSYIDEELDKMLKEGVIEPSSSPWSFPVVMVRKKDNSYRFCVDYRKLNKITKKDAYPLPVISSILDKLRMTKYLSALDIKSAYWQVGVANESRELTAFSVPGRGHYQFCRMPFGLTNAPATFQRLIDNTIGHDLEPFVFQYLDDLIIVTPTFEKHLEILQKVFNRLRSAKLVLSKEKCKFCLPRLRYLGFMIDNTGLHVDPEKVAAILNIPSPTSVTEVRRFLGMASWYRRFIPQFATLTAPLSALVGKKRKWQWSEVNESAFNAIKERLVTAPVLSRPNFDLPFVVQTDASGYGIGAVLTQIHDDGEHVISYISRTLNRAERNYGTTQRECLAVIWAIEKFRGYLEGYKFTVVTDHHSLLWLQNIKEPTGKLCRWALRLQAFDFEIVHRKGRNHVVPDALSRLLPDSELNLANNNDTECNEGTAKLSIITVQTKSTDNWYNKMLTLVSENPLNYAQWRVENEQLYKYPGNDKNQEAHDQLGWKIVVPKELRNQVLKECHDNPSSGHLGVHKTYFRVKDKYYWPKMRSDVAKYVRSCVICLEQKPEQKSPAGLLSSHPRVSKPWQMISMDLVGPLPRSSNGYTFILVGCDTFSKFPIFFPLRKATARAVAKIVEEDIILFFGAPQFILCDNGVQFRSKELAEVVRRYGTKIIFNPVYHPQANPTERVNRVLKTMIRSYVKNDHKKWDLHLKSFACAIRTAHHEVTGFTPFELNFGRKYVSHGSFYGKTLSTNDINFEERKVPLLEDSFNIVKAKLDSAYERSRKIYNLRRRHVEFRPGDFVWRKNYVLSNAERSFATKLAPKFLGPFRIKKKIGYNTYVLEDDENSGKRVWHVKDLKPHSDRTEVEENDR